MLKVIKFSASWCNPCKSMTKQLESIETYKEVQEVDIDTEIDEVKKYSIRGILWLVAVDANGEVSRLQGFKSASELQEWFDMVYAS